MTPAPPFDWLGWSLGLDGAALFVYLAAFYKFGDRTEVHRTSLSGVTNLLREIERELAAELAVRLQPLFSGEIRPTIEITTLLNADGNPFREVTINPVGTEEYRDAIREFVLADAGAMVAYRSVTFFKRQWVGWARRLSWLLLAGVVLHGAMGFGLLGARLASWDVSIRLIAFGGALSFLVFIGALSCAVCMMRRHDQIQHYKLEYGTD